MSRPGTSPSGLYGCYDDVYLLAGVRTPWVDFTSALALVSATDLGIKVGRAVLDASGVLPEQIDQVLVGSVAQTSFDAFVLPRHVGLYCGVPDTVPALLLHRVCGTGFELFRQAADQITLGHSRAILCVATESMSRNPIAAYTHRSGFRLGVPVEFRDFLNEALVDPAVAMGMLDTGEKIARLHGLGRQQVDAFAARSFARALEARERGWLAGEIVPMENETFVVDGLHARGIALPGKIERIEHDTHPRPTPLDTLARLRTVKPDGVHTAGNVCAIVDGAAAAVIVGGDALNGRRPLARIAAVAVTGLDPSVMGLGPVNAIGLLLARSGLDLAEIARFEINEAQGGQVLACARELGIDEDRLNVHGGAIALGHPLAATGVRLVVTLARQLHDLGARWGIASACIGGGQGIAVLVENPHMGAG